MNPDLKTGASLRAIQSVEREKKKKLVMASAIKFNHVVVSLVKSRVPVHIMVLPQDKLWWLLLWLLHVMSYYNPQ